MLRSPRRGRLEARIALFTALALGASIPSLAQTPSPISVAVNAGVASDYVFRGVDQTHGGVEGFGGLDLSRGDVYVGTFGSTVDLRRFGDARADAELDAYGGWRPTLFGYDLDMGAIAYTYVDPAMREDHVEAYAKASRAIGPFSAGLSIYASPQYPRAAGPGAYFEGKAAYAPTRKLTLSATLGDQYQAHALAPAPCRLTPAGCAGPYGDLSYVDWSLGGTYALTDQIGLDLRYTDTDAHAVRAPYGARLVLSARATFP